MNMRTVSRFVLLTIVGLFGAVSAAAQTGPLQFFAVAPCRAVDTRGGPAVGQGETRNVVIRGTCGVPTSAKAVSLNVTIVSPTQFSFLTLWPSGGARPNVSTINFAPTDLSLANGAIVAVSTNAADLSVFNSDGQVHVLLDVTGYFQ